MRMYNAHVELERQRLTEDQVDAMMDGIEPFHGALGRGPDGWISAQISVPAENLTQAAAIAIAAVEGAARGAGFTATAIGAEVLTEELFNRRQGWEDEPGAADQPSVIGSEEASKILGVSRQRVMQLADEGRLATIPVGARARGFVRGDVVRLAQDRGRMTKVLDPDDRAGRG